MALWTTSNSVPRHKGCSPSYRQETRVWIAKTVIKTRAKILQRAAVPLLTEELLLRMRRLQSLEGCACPLCQPTVFQGVIHAEDSKKFSIVGGLTWRRHDAWYLASLIEESTNKDHRQQLSEVSLVRWKLWAERHPATKFRILLPKALNETDFRWLIDIFSDIFFLGQLSWSNLRVRWHALPRGFLGFTSNSPRAEEPTIIWLNSNAPTLQRSTHATLRVVLHEMIHAFLGMYACQIWVGPQEEGGVVISPAPKLACSNGICAKRWLSNVGTTGHGRAWQYAAKAIETAMPSLLGFGGGLGRFECAAYEINAGASLPCNRDAELVYPWRSALSMWQFYMRAQDDDAVMHRRMSRFASRCLPDRLRMASWCEGRRGSF